MTPLTLGYMPLTDCVPLVMAKHLGIFEKWGLDVTLSRQNSWATLRDKLHADILDGAHMLAPMPFASALGLGGKADVIAPFVLSRQGNGITLSQTLFSECVSNTPNLVDALPLPASRLQAVIENRAKEGSKLTFATVYPYSCHFYQLRSWLAQYQIPIESVSVIVIPPSHMVEALARGDIDGFCVGSPWNAQAVRSDIGVTVATSCDIWPSMPEKVLGVKREFSERNPEDLRKLISALKETCAWLAFAPNRFEAARVLTQPDYIGAKLDVLTPSLLGSCLTKDGENPRLIPHYNLFGQENGEQANCPTVAQGEWILTQMVEAGHVDKHYRNQNFVASVYREDLYACSENEQTLHQYSEA